jgi:signal peptidase I
VRRAGGKLLTALCATALIVVVAFILVPGLLGLQRFVITGGSMTGTIPKGAVIYSRVVPASQLRVGDIITFTPPGNHEAVTHRIIAIERGPGGQPAYRTKGDYNQAPDPWNPVTLNEPTQARYVFQVPLLGYALAALTLRSVRLAAVGIPAMLIALSILWTLWREAGEEVARERDGDLMSDEDSAPGSAQQIPVPRGTAAPDRLPHDSLSRA